MALDSRRLRNLVDKAVAGDREALAGALAVVHRRLIGLAYGICCDQALAEDAVQDADARAILGVGKLRDPAAFVTWIERVTVRSSLDQLRWSTRSVPTDAVPELPTASMDHIGRLTVRDALRQLPAQQRATVVLFYWLDMPIDAIATTLACEEGTVKSRLARARELLANLLEVDSLNA